MVVQGWWVPRVMGTGTVRTLVGTCVHRPGTGSGSGFGTIPHCNGGFGHCPTVTGVLVTVPTVTGVVVLIPHCNGGFGTDSHCNGGFGPIPGFVSHTRICGPIPGFVVPGWA